MPGPFILDLRPYLNRPDPRFEDNPAFVRDPGNSQENNDSNASTGVPFDPQTLKKQPRMEMDQNTFQLRQRLGIKGRGA